jgi:hypothetical protein
VVEKVKRASRKLTHINQPGPNEHGATSKKANQAPSCHHHFTEKDRARATPEERRGKEKERANPRVRENMSSTDSVLRQTGLKLFFFEMWIKCH